MSVIRQDAWSSDEDLILAEVVLRHIREGSTQLAAFEEVGERLSRTSAACGFRWNSTIRKKYDAAIALAKKQRKKLKQEQDEQVEVEVEFAEEQTMEQVYEIDDDTKDEMEDSEVEPLETIKGNTLTLTSVINFLKEHEAHFSNGPTMKKENESLKKENEQLRLKIDNLSKEIEETRKEKEIINEDYRALIGIMDRARKMSIIVDDSKEKVKTRK